MKKYASAFKRRLSRKGRKAKHIVPRGISRSGLLLAAGLIVTAPHAAAGVSAHDQADGKGHHKHHQHHGQHGYHGFVGRKSELAHDQVDTQLQQGLQEAIGSLKLQGAANNGQLSVALVDVTDPKAPRLAMVNGDDMHYAASLPKIAILFGAFQKIHDGQMELDAETRKQLNDMIRVSSNRAATAVLDKIGRRYLSDLLQSKRYQLYDPEHNGGLWVGKPYASGGAYHRDPLHNISHGATAFQVARFYYMIETGQLVSPEFSRQMKQILGNPGIHHKFVKGLEKEHPEARIFRKSGSWRHFHADSAIVERAGRRYIAVALAEHTEGGKWLEELIVAMDDLVFEKPAPIKTAKADSESAARL